MPNDWEQYAEPQIDPDILLQRGTAVIVWIYTPSGKLHYEVSDELTHGDLLHARPELAAEVTVQDYEWPREAMSRQCMMGRTGELHGDPIIAIWPGPQQLFLPCLRKLVDAGVADTHATVYSPYSQGEILSELLDQETTPAADPQQVEKLALAQQMHLARGDEKKAIMKKLGVGGGGVEPKITKALKKNNLLKPGQKYWAMQSESSSSTNSDIDWSQDGPGYDEMSHYSPDDLLYANGQVFIYTKSGKLYSDDSDETTHNELYYRAPYALRQEVDLNYDEGQRRSLGKTSLCGRTGTFAEQHRVAFWNAEQNIWDKCLIPCLQKLLEQNIINPDTMVYTPVGNTGDLVSDLLESDASGQIDQERAEQLELAQQMHLARGDEKKAIMKKLGVGGGGVEPKITQALKKNNLLKPGQKYWAMNSEAVVKEGEADLIRKLMTKNRAGGGIQPKPQPKFNPAKPVDPKTVINKPKYINPDDIFIPPFKELCTFIYPAKTKQLYVDKGNIVHTTMMRENPKIVQDLGLDPKNTKWMVFMREEPAALEMGLFGRVGCPSEGQPLVVSFWQTPTEIFQELLPDCLQQLLSKNIIQPDSKVHHPALVDVPVSDVVKGSAQAVQDDAAMQRAELARKMHLARGDEKKAIMKKLGVGGGGVEPKITQALKKANLLKPGQKYWAMHSESVVREVATPGSKPIMIGNFFDDAEFAPEDKTPPKDIHPDLMFGNKYNTTFVYTQDGQLLTISGDKSHHWLMQEYLESQGIADDQEWELLRTSLLGRLGWWVHGIADGSPGDSHYVTFWNDGKHPAEKVIPVLQELLRRDLITQDTVLSFPGLPLQPVSQFLGDYSQVRDTSKDADFDKYRELHLLRGDEKKAKMRELGVGGGGVEPKITRALKQANLLKPGQKYWAMGSESKT